MSDPVVALRHRLHRHPELSGDEAATAREIGGFFADLEPDDVVEGLGGHGLAFVFAGENPGPTVLLRCELDALPIHEANASAHRSRIDGVAHQCGHDGHMAILAAVGTALAKARPARGRVVLLYQPAEETGAGAAAVVRDPRFARIRPDYAFAAHNLPGHPLGQVVVRPGPMTCASRGVVVELGGQAAHAAQPHTGRSPAAAMCRIVDALSGPFPGLPENEVAFATVVGARLGDKAFGTAPGQAEVWATLRSETDATMARMIEHAERIARASAARQGLDLTMRYEDVFHATINAARAVDVVRRAARPGPVLVPERPFIWSEDFGRIAEVCDGALFGIGSGQDVPALHDPGYDFPDELIGPAASIMGRIVEAALSAEPRGEAVGTGVA